jgi:hypothetical protein
MYHSGSVGILAMVVFWQQCSGCVVLAVLFWRQWCFDGGGVLAVLVLCCSALCCAGLS